MVPEDSAGFLIAKISSEFTNQCLSTTTGYKPFINLEFQMFSWQKMHFVFRNFWKYFEVFTANGKLATLMVFNFCP